MDSLEDLKDELVRLATLAVGGGPEKSRVHLLRRARELLPSDPALAHALREAASQPRMSAPEPSPVRRAAPAWASGERPEDQDSQLDLLRIEAQPVLTHEPIYDAAIGASLRALVLEYQQSSLLLKEGLHPTRSLLLAGPPGVGKTLAARWLAVQMGVPLFVLDLGAVMSRFLGATGVNLKKAFAYARHSPGILLLDELDAVAKRRDDSSDVGELKRLVTVMLQELDEWPEGRLVIGATNHPQLLDPAVFRRFEVRLDLLVPNEEVLASLVETLYPAGTAVPKLWLEVLPSLLAGTSHNEMLRTLTRMRRSKAMNPDLSDEEILRPIAEEYAVSMSTDARRRVSLSLAEGSSLSDRFLASTFKVSRDTLRRARKGGA